MHGAPVPPPDINQVQRIAAVSDPVVRNLQITQCYHELSTAMARLTGPGANWCSVATWASKQAGQSIRREDLARTFRRLLDEAATAPAEALAAAEAELSGEERPNLGAAAGALWDALNPAGAFKRTSEAVAIGNRKVFEEIGFEFARFLAAFDEGWPDEARLNDFNAGLLPGDPPEGQRYLRQAFTHYHRALGTDDPKDKAELLLLANLEIGFHEQTRLQPEIVAAMNAPVADPRVLRRRLMEALFPDAGSGWREWLAGLGERAQPLIAARDRLAGEAQRVGRLAITEHMMTLEVPDGRTLRLGQDLRVAFPDLLRSVSQPELAALLAQVDPTADSAYGTGAEDWGNLPDRMHFIADLFRAYHLAPALFDPPFTAVQTGQIVNGRRPEGRL
jgi:hypothetical protein